MSEYSESKASSCSDTIECPICMETKHPKCLPCLHRFCLDCLKRYGKEEQPGDSIPCPVCRQAFQIPEERCESLPICAPSLEFNCEAKNCAERNVSNYCDECDQCFCEACLAVHGNYRGNRSHRVISLKGIENPKAFAQSRPVYCREHMDEELQTYCYYCELVLCFVCLETSHASHNSTDLKAASEEFRQQLGTEVARVNISVDAVRNKSKSLSDNRDSLLKQLTECERAMAEQCKKLKRLINSQFAKMLNELASIKNERLKALQTKMEEVQLQTLILGSFKSNIVELLDNRWACQIVQKTKSFLSRAEDLEGVKPNL